MRLLFLNILMLVTSTAFTQPESYNSQEWSELKTRVQQASIIGLGEAGHGYESINRIKSIL